MSRWVVVLNDYEAIKEALVGKSIEFAGRIDDPREKHFREYWPIKGERLTLTLTDEV